MVYTSVTLVANTVVLHIMHAFTVAHQISINISSLIWCKAIMSSVKHPPMLEGLKKL